MIWRSKTVTKRRKFMLCSSFVDQLYKDTQYFQLLSGELSTTWIFRNKNSHCVLNPVPLPPTRSTSSSCNGYYPDNWKEVRTSQKYDGGADPPLCRFRRREHGLDIRHNAWNALSPANFKPSNLCILD